MILLSPRDLLIEMTQRLYHAECQLTLALPRTALRAQHPELGAAIQRHLVETGTHALRLEQIAAALDIPAWGVVNHAVMGLLKDAGQDLNYGGDPLLVDRAIIASCQAVEHYEISQYTAYKALAEAAGVAEAADLAGETLTEEEDTSRTLEQILAQIASAQPSDATLS